MCTINLKCYNCFPLQKFKWCTAQLTWFPILKEKTWCLFCWVAINLPWAHQSLLAVWVQSKKAYMWTCTCTHIHKHRLPFPPAVRVEKTSMQHVMFQSLCQEWSLQTLHWALPYFITLSLCWGLRWRAVPAVTTWRNESRPRPTWI